MEKVKEFILKFLDKEAECWTRLNSNELDAFNQAVREFCSMAIEGVEKGLGISERTDFGIFTRTEKEIVENPLINMPRYLYKISAYKNKTYGDIWVAYVSTKNPNGEPNEDVFSDGFIMSEIDSEFKVIGILSVKLSTLTMVVTGWKGNVYNPSDLDFKKLGKFISTERYSEPANHDDFSLNEYLKDK